MTSPQHNEEQLEPELDREVFRQLADPVKWHFMNKGVGELNAGIGAGAVVLAQTPAILELLARECQATRTAVVEGRRDEASWWAIKLQQYHSYTGGGKNPYAAEINGRIAWIQDINTLV